MKPMDTSRARAHQVKRLDFHPSVLLPDFGCREEAVAEFSGAGPDEVAVSSLPLGTEKGFRL